MFGRAGKPRFRISGWLVALYGAAVAAVPLGGSWLRLGATHEVGPPSAMGQGAEFPRAVNDGASTPVGSRVLASDPVGAAGLVGIFWGQRPAQLGDPLRFYYFHGDGHGLYRYGRLGYSNTHSFDYRVEDHKSQPMLIVTFRKTGAVHRIPFRLVPDEAADGRTWLELRDDPKARGPGRYVREADGGPVRSESDAARLATPEAGSRPSPGPAGRLWIDRVAFAEGGSQFSLYQLKDAGIDGRGVGWHHLGDFDDWTTESFAYRITGDRLEFEFDLRREHAVTTFRRASVGRDETLTLEADPRDFWHARTFFDAGPSFGATAGVGLSRLQVWAADARSLTVSSER